MKHRFFIDGITCGSCVKLLTNALNKIEGIKTVKIKENGDALVSFDASTTSIDEVYMKIKEKGYAPGKMKTMNKIIALVGVLILAYFAFQFSGFLNGPRINEQLSWAMVLLVGFLTSFHCVGMCGGFVMSYASTGKKSSHIQYASGKLLSYAGLGALFGFLGSLVTFTPMLRGVAGILAGTFLLLFGLKLLNIINFAGFRFPSSITDRIKGRGPFGIGILNGFMIACGPLQAMYILAAGYGDPIKGASLLFLFGLGTLPLLLGFGLAVQKITGAMRSRVNQLSGAIVIVMGLLMVSQGLSLTGHTSVGDFETSEMVAEESVVLAASDGICTDGESCVDDIQVIKMEVTRSGWQPNTFNLKKGVPVRWEIEGKEINGCNNAIVVPEYGLEFDVNPGMQTIEFTPDKAGVFDWSCWMGMIPGRFIVQEGDEPAPVAIEPVPKGGSCGGGCGCGGR